jgi:hypothetical protein
MQTPAQLLTITRRYFEQLSQTEEDDTAKWMRALEMPERADLAAIRISDMSPVWGAMLRDTVAPTGLHAGIRSDVVPAEATANLDVRLLPGDSLDAVLALLQKTVNDPQVKFKVSSAAFHERNRFLRAAAAQRASARPASFSADGRGCTEDGWRRRTDSGGQFSHGSGIPIQDGVRICSCQVNPKASATPRLFAP